MNIFAFDLILAGATGLTMKAGRAPMDVHVIDHVEKPTAN
jgi:hypothetical protein